ncbi:hypothetical protein SAMN05660657_02186 [Geodermatophilus amargosae]|uniref:Uncharacterized protein n=1 Tax=Geodermatophilus amargosae TaxID=1296565 RepID=A0A1I6ZSM6_9ACTN|nr:hypothetical protein SAMN05660657_02186 [Geodermatophilus amargosae]
MSFRVPQDVEVSVDGAWLPGAMLGWRVDETGGAQALVVVRDAGGRESWTDLAGVRLPERHLSLAPAMTEVPGDTPGTVVMSAVGRPAGAPGARSARRPTRRHGGDVTAEQPAVAASAAGRHRAPAGSGRHRAATAEMPAVPCAAPALDDSADPAADLTVDLTADTAVGTAGDTAGEPDLLTRPIRLGDLVPNLRGGRPAVRPPA